MSSMRTLISLFCRKLPSHSLWRTTVVAMGVLTQLAVCAPGEDAPAKKAREGTPTLKGAAEAKAKAKDYAFTPDPRLPNVLLLGDSISVGYTLTVRKQLKGVANVFRPLTEQGLPQNCCGTFFWFDGNLERWLQMQPKWDVIHFNSGLHDIMRLDLSRPRKVRVRTYTPEAPPQVPLTRYQENLEKLVAVLQGTGAKLVFGTTTPVVTNCIPAMLPEDVVAYNEAACAIMKKHQVAINDLYARMLPRQAELQYPGNCHFTEGGNGLLGEAVAEAIRPLLPPQAGPGGGGAAKPNIVFFLIDDMPWYGTGVPMDKAIPGSAMKFAQTPNLEKLARQGMTFRNARSAAAICSPSRCSIQTGMMTAHTLFSANTKPPRGKSDGTVKYIEHPDLLLSEPESQSSIRFPSLGDVLRNAGYTTGHFGKWHIFGGGPARHGYDESDGDTGNKDGRNPDPVTDKVLDVSEDPKLLFSITGRGMNFMERSVKAGKPFFLQLSHYAVHGGYQARPATLKKYEDNPLFAQIADSKERHWAMVAAAMVEDLDTAIGMTLDKIKALGIEKNTYVVMTSDNGSVRWNEAYTHLLRGDKWWLWEMGIRVPLIVRGPGIAAGSQSSVNVVGYDFLPTFAELAGAGGHLPKAVDGASFVPVLFGKPLTDEYVNRPILFHYPHYAGSPPCSAMVRGELKLLHFYEWPDEHYVCNLAEDLGEEKNLDKADPQRAAQMYQAMMEQFKAVGACFPKPNPNVRPGARRYNPNDPNVRSSEWGN